MKNETNEQVATELRQEAVRRRREAANVQGTLVGGGGGGGSCSTIGTTVKGTKLFAAGPTPARRKRTPIPTSRNAVTSNTDSSNGYNRDSNRFGDDQGRLETARYYGESLLSPDESSLSFGDARYAASQDSRKRGMSGGDVGEVVGSSDGRYESLLDSCAGWGTTLTPRKEAVPKAGDVAKLAPRSNRDFVAANRMQVRRNASFLLPHT